MLQELLINQCYQRAHFAAILCALLSDSETPMTHEDVKAMICKSLVQCSSYGVGDHIEETLLKRANAYVDQHNAVIEANQILNQ